MPIFEDQSFKDYVNSLPAATKSDLAAGNNMPIVSASEIKKMGGENVAKGSLLDEVVLNSTDFHGVSVIGQFVGAVNNNGVIVTSSSYFVRYIPVSSKDMVLLRFFELIDDKLTFGFFEGEEPPKIGDSLNTFEKIQTTSSTELYEKFLSYEKKGYVVFSLYATLNTKFSARIGRGMDKIDKIDGKADMNSPILYKDGDIKWDYYFDASGTERSTSGGNYGVTTFYKIPKEGISFRSAGNTNFANAVVYDENQRKVKTISSSATFYVPEVGEEYIRFLIIKSLNWPFQANKGNALEPSGVAYSQLVDVESKLDCIKNGNLNVLRTAMGLSGGNGPIDYVNETKTLEKTLSAEGNFSLWAYLTKKITTGDGVLNASTDQMLVVEYDVDVESSDIGTTHALWITNGAVNVQGEYQKVAEFNESGHVRKEFDLAYYAQYKGWTEFNFWFALDGRLVGTHKVVIRNLKIYQYLDGKIFANFEGRDVSELFESVDKKFNEVIENKSEYIVSPQGQKFTLAVDEEGNAFGIPLYPRKASFIGNSLIRGNVTFGMNASQSDKDYYYLIGNFISGKRSDFVQNRIYGSNLEHSETLAAARTNIAAIVAEIPSDADFVSIQMGDNVNTDAKRDVFDTSCGEFISAIRTKAPRAKVVWFGIWYGNPRVYSRIQTECAVKGVRFINIGSLNTKGNQSFIGAIINRGVVENRTLSDVTNVTANTANNITVAFVVGGNNYTSQLDVESYSLSGTTLSYRSQYLVTSSSGVATHPGDNGFRLIANKVLYSLGMTDDEEYYKET